MEKKQFVGMTLRPEIVRKVDSARGLIPRSTYVEHILEKALQQGGI